MKKIAALILSLVPAFMVFPFDYPQNITEDSYNSYFGQRRGDILSTSLVFSKPSDIKASEDGHVLIVMTEENDDSDFFPSTLGTAVILAHEDSLLSVYGNLETDSLTFDKESDHDIESGDLIGHTGNTGWQTTKNSLEFQIIDTNNNTAINPKILMPRTEKELPLRLSDITLKNKKGRYFDLNKTRTYQAGYYKIYQKRNNIASPYKTTVVVNGVTVDQIIYDTISQENGKSCVSGKKKYNSEDIYPTEDLQLLGEAMLTPGKATISLYCEDILSNTKHISYNVSIY